MRVITRIQSLVRRLLAKKKFMSANDKWDSLKRDCKYFAREEQFETLSKKKIFKPD